MSRNTIIGIIAVLLVGGGIIWYVQKQSNTDSSQPYGTISSRPVTSSSPVTQTKGKVIFSVTDAAASMQNISSVQMTVGKVELYNETGGWITVSNETKQFDLLKLKTTGKFAFEATADVPTGTYNQIRMHVDKVIVVQSGVAKQAKLPSAELKINGDVRVVSGATTSVKLDFLADKSLHVTGKGEFVFAPVIKLEIRSGANVKITSDGNVNIQGGTVDVDVNEGMDINGEMKENFILKIDSNLEIDGGVIKLK